MLNRISRILAMLLLCAATVLARAQGAPEAAPEAKKPLSLAECLDVAMANQVDVLVGANSLTASQARRTQARSDYYPQVTLETTQTVLTSGLNGRDRNNSGLGITQNFYDGGLREAKVARAKYDVEQSDAALVRTRQTVTFSVTRAYFALLRAQHLAEVANRRVSYTEEQRNMVKARIDAGDAAQVELLPLDAQLANAHVDQLAAKNAIRTSAVQLQQAMGLLPQTTFAIEDVTLRNAQQLPGMDECLTQALAQRPEVRESKAAIGSAQAGVKTAKINMGPRPVISGELGQPIGNGNNMTYSLTGGIAFNLFDGNSTRAAYQEAKTSLSSSELRAKQTTRDITADVQEAYLNVTDARERMDASALSLSAAQRNFDAQQERYAQGLAIPLDLLNAQLEVTTAQSNAVQAQYDYLTALGQLHYAMGKQGGVTWE